MTHWVIRKYNGKIYAGVDKLASGPDARSELSADGTMPGVHDELPVAKLVQYGSASCKSRCIICCSGDTYLRKVDEPDPEVKEETKGVLEAILCELDIENDGLEKIANNAKILLQSIYVLLEGKGYRMTHLRLGCGFATSALTIAYCDWRPEIKKQEVEVDGDYLNIGLETEDRFKADLLSGGGAAMGYIPAEFAIANEIEKASRERPGRVSRDSDILSISPTVVPASTLIGAGLSSGSGAGQQPSNSDSGAAGPEAATADSFPFTG
jgi:hypothetical protein